VVNTQKYKPLNNREKCLLAYISNFHLKLRYIPGRLNKVADVVPRLPEDVKNEKCRVDPQQQFLHLKPKQQWPDQNKKPWMSTTAM